MKKKSTLILTLVILATQHLFAVPANPAPETILQSDGSEITVHLRGDEFFSWHETTDGYMLIRQENGDFVRATFDQHLELQRVKSELPERRSVRRPSTVRTQQQGPQIGRQMVVLVEFADVHFRTSYTGTPLFGKELFDSIMNAENHTINGAVGSVRQYFLDVSNGMFDAQSTVFGPIRLAENRAFYGGNDAQGWDLRPHIMVQQALQALANQGTDFRPFVNPATNLVDGVHVIFAGCGEENMGCPAEAIWSHQWVVSGTGATMTIGNATFDVYSVSPELAGGAASTTPTHIGVIVHELGHSLLGWPDSYSVGNNCVDFGNWCVMASGVWNHDGRRPAKPSAWFVADAGWVEERVLDAPQNVAIPNPAHNRVIYRINTQTPNEYFLLDNRQQVGWDQFIPSSGMLISHVDRTAAAAQDWARNEILTFCNRRRLYIKQPGCANIAGCAPLVQGFPNPNRPTDVWPQPGFTEFTDNSVPNAQSWAGQNTNRPVTEITQNTTERVLWFRFMGGVSYSIALSQTVSHSFASAMYGYDPAPESLSVRVLNTGKEPTGLLTIALSGANASSFVLSNTDISNILVGNTSSFTVAPNLGLDVGHYTATVTVSGSNGISQSFDVSFTVVPIPTYDITLSQTEIHTFDTLFLGYNQSELTPLVVTITNTGNQPTGELNIALSGTNASNFTLSRTSVSSIATGLTDDFTVVPIAGLLEGTHTATVTVTGETNISENFDVRFTVNRTPTTVPYFEGFETSGSGEGQPLPEGWTQFSHVPNAPPDVWFPLAGVALGGVEFRPHTGQRQMVRFYRDAGYFAWAFSESILLYADTSYTVSFWFVAPGEEQHYDNFKVQIGPSRNLSGTGADAEMMGATTLLEHEDQSTPTWTQVTVEFIPTISGPHYIGFHCTTEEGDGFFIAIDDISIVRTNEKDTTPPSNVVEMLHATPLRVFPNPVTDNLYIVIPSDIVIPNEMRDLEIFDMNGRRVFIHHVETGRAPSLRDDNTIVIDISHLPNGTYIVRIGNRSTVIVKQ